MEAVSNIKRKNMSQYFGYLIESEKHKSKAVIWISTKVKGSVPRKSIYKMLVLPTGKIIGTVEENPLDKLMIEKSLGMLRNNHPNLYRIRS